MAVLLEPNIIDIYYGRTDRLQPELGPEMVGILDADEIRTFNAYRREEKRREFLLGRRVLKQVLAFQLGEEPEKVPLMKTAHGKLYLDRRTASGERIGFNLSHSGGLVACAFLLDREIGIDVERADRSLKEISDRFFHPREIEFLRRWGDRERNRHALEIWTRKEAYTKAVGLGMTVPFEEVNILERDDAFLATREQPSGYLTSVAVLGGEENFTLRFLEF